MASENIIMALEEKRKWESRLAEMESELDSLIKDRKDILKNLAEIRITRKKLYNRLCDHYAKDAETEVIKARGESPNVSIR